MRDRYLLTSVTRISDLEAGNFEVSKLPRDQWADADYVVGRVLGSPSNRYSLELANGRLMEVMEGARVVGAFGKRTATLEAVGDWEEIGDDGVFEASGRDAAVAAATQVANGAIGIGSPRASLEANYALR